MFWYRLMEKGNGCMRYASNADIVSRREPITGNAKPWVLPSLALLLSGCTFDPKPLHRLNAQFEENSTSLRKNVRYLNQLTENTVRLYFDLQIASARRHVRDEFRGAYVSPAPGGAEPAASPKKPSESFRRENADTSLDFVTEAAYFARSFEDPEAFTVFSSNQPSKFTFLDLHARVLTGNVGVLSGEPLRQYRDTLQKYYTFLDRYRPALTYVKKKAAFEEAFARFQALLEEELDNEREFLKGYKRVAEMKDPVTELVSSLRLSNDDKDLLLNVINEVKDSGVARTLNNKLEQ